MAELFEMPRRETPDAAERRRALDASQSWIVEAPAGSGKTALLIQRYLTLLADDSVTEPEQVMAITFTRAATEEIRERVLRELRRADEGVAATNKYDKATRAMAAAVLARDRQFGWGLLEEPRRLRVRTIDAVCAEIARALPVLSGGGGALTPVEKPVTLYREAARRTWMHLGGPDGALDAALRLLLLHRDGDLRACELLLAEMLADREQWGALIPLDDEGNTEEVLESTTRPRLDASLERVVCEGLGKLARAFPPGVLGALTRLAAELADAPPYEAGYHPFAMCRALQDAPGEAAEHMAHWKALAELLLTKGGTWRKVIAKNSLGVDPSPKQRATLKMLLEGVRDSDALLEALQEFSLLPPAKYPNEQWEVTKALFRALRQALVELQVVFSERGACDFVEPALMARYALSRDGATHELEAAMGVGLRHLLVDEMQDTSTRQYELIERLTDGWASEGKTVFLVGDPKQSIYLFRQARVERFVETMRTERLGTLPVKALRLTANFRSQAGLVAGFNEDFAAIFPQTAERPEDVEYVRVEASRRMAAEVAGEGGTAWHLSVCDMSAQDAKTDRQRQSVRDARAMRRVMEAWRARPLPHDRTEPWKIAVLVRSRRSLARVLPELRRQVPVPFRAVRIDTLNERREVLDVIALTRALLHPADRTAWLAVLRAPWCGLALADLHQLTGADDLALQGRTVMELLELRGTELSPDGVERLGRVWPVLEAAVKNRGRVRLPELVERTWRSLHGNVYLEATPLENVAALLELLQTMDREAGEVTMSELSRRVGELYAAPDQMEGAVDLITIHGAKGLEWDVVLVPEMARRAPSAKARLLEWEELPEGGVVLAPIAGKGEASHALSEWLRALRAKREAAERKRLFYVACTRAKEELHLFGMASMRRDGGVSADAGTLLAAAWPAAEQRLGTVTRDQQARQEVGLDLAAAAEVTRPAEHADEQPAILERLGLDWMATSGPIEPRSAGIEQAMRRSTGSQQMAFARPEGSFRSRALGTAVHAFLEKASDRLVQGTTAAELLRELPQWEARVRAVLRASGQAPTTVDAQVRTVLTALRHTLEDDIGRWMLGARSGGRSELALTLWEEERRQYRMDRSFRAGAEPGRSGEDYLWIVDYKTATDATLEGEDSALQSFLDREQVRYTAQLETYARVMGEPETRLGLWFPLMRQLRWWVAGQGMVMEVRVEAGSRSGE